MTELKTQINDVFSTNILNRPKEKIDAVFPINIPRIIPAIPAFRAVKGKVYRIPFVASNLSLGNLFINADTDYFSTLEASKFDEMSGYINLVTTFSSIGEKSSIITLLDENSGVSSSLLACHSRLVNGLVNTKTTVTNNIINAIWRTEIDSKNQLSYSVLEPKFTLSEDIKFKAYYSRDGFNQSYIFKEYGYFNDFDVKIVLEEPFTGDLVINFEDLAQGTGGTALVYVDYKG